jgi:uncharacterized protein (TIGR02265 family)
MGYSCVGPYARFVLRIRPERPLVGDVDAEERFERFPSGHLMKGMFFNRMVALGGARIYSDVAPRLIKRPLLGRYVPFSEYPQVDFSRLAHAVAVARFPRVDVVEAMRQLAREDISVFAESAIGSVMLALSGRDPTRALLKLPDMYAASLRGGAVSARQLAPDVVELDYRDFFGWLDCYPIGHIEGLCEFLEHRSEIEVEASSEVDAVLRVRVARRPA